LHRGSDASGCTYVSLAHFYDGFRRDAGAIIRSAALLLY
jgi:hypothetical protein